MVTAHSALLRRAIVSRGQRPVNTVQHSRETDEAKPPHLDLVASEGEVLQQWNVEPLFRQIQRQHVGSTILFYRRGKSELYLRCHSWSLDLHQFLEKMIKAFWLVVQIPVPTTGQNSVRL